jgi:hypothetical protein
VLPCRFAEKILAAIETLATVGLLCDGAVDVNPPMLGDSRDGCAIWAVYPDALPVGLDLVETRALRMAASDDGVDHDSTA